GAPARAEAPHRVDPYGPGTQREPDRRAGRGASRGPGRARPSRRARQRRRARGEQGLEGGGGDDPPARVSVPHEVATRAAGALIARFEPPNRTHFSLLDPN